MQVKNIIKFGIGSGINFAVLKEVFSANNDIKPSPEIESEGLALNSNPNFRYGTAIERAMFVPAYQQHRSQSLQQKDWTHKYKSKIDRKESEMKFDEEYAKKAQEHFGTPGPKK